jgi:hypothetical protein
MPALRTYLSKILPSQLHAEHPTNGPRYTFTLHHVRMSTRSTKRPDCLNPILPAADGA